MTKDAAPAVSSEVGHTVTRRNFFKLAVSSISMLPAVAGGFLLPGPEVALADEKDLADVDPTRIVVVSPKQVGLIVTDQADDKNAPIEGATVTLTSRFNGTQGTATTDSQGIAVFDIETFAETDHEDGVYAFNGTIDVVADGYREFHMSLARIEGATALSVPTRALEPGVPYPSRASFCEWDILYTKNGFVSTVANDADCEIKVEIRNLSEKATLTLCDRDKKDKVYASMSLSPSSGVATGAVTKAFLLKGGADALPIGGQFFMKMETASHSYEFPVAIEVEEGAEDEYETKPQQDVPPANGISPFPYKIDMPGYIPGLQGQTLVPWSPSWPITLVLDPFGFLYLSVVISPRWGYINDGGKADKSRWKLQPYRSSYGQWMDYKNKANEAFKSVYKQISSGRGFKVKHHKLAKSISLMLSLTISAWANVQKEKKEEESLDGSVYSWNGGANLAGLAELAASLTEQFFVGPVPAFIQLGINGSFVVQAAGIGITTTDGSDLSKYDWDYTNTGLTLTLNLAPYLSAGVGFAGICSIGLRGVITICIFMGITIKPDPDVPLPHWIIGWSGAVSIEVQAFLFRWSGKICSFNRPKVVDNWIPEEDWDPIVGEGPAIPGSYTIANGLHSYEVAPGTLASNDAFGWGVLMNEMTPVTLEDLAVTMESRLTSNGAPNAIYDFSSAVALEADEGGFEATLYPWDDALVAGAGSSVWTETRTKELYPSGHAGFGVDRVNEEDGGIWPKSDDKIIEGVFSDSRMKVVGLSSGHETYERDLACVFRIASVEVDGKMRSRVVYQTYLTGYESPTVVNVESGIEGVPASDLFVYDYSVTTDPKNHAIYLFMLSGTRNDSPDITPSEAFENLVFTFVSYTYTAGAQLYLLHSFSWPALNEKTVQGVANAFFCPNVTYICGDSFDNNDHVWISWLHRYTEDASVGLDSDDAKVRLGGGCVNNEGVTLFKIEKNISVLADSTFYDLVATNSTGDSSSEFTLYFALRGHETTSIVRIEGSLPTDEQPLRISRGSQIHDHLPLTARLTPWPNHSGFLTSYEGKLQQFDPEQATFTSLGLEEFKVDSFGTDDTGNFLYWTENRVGDVGFTYENSESPAPLRSGAEDYRIMASKNYNGHFSDPYVFANTKHSLEDIAYVAYDGSQRLFLSTSITDYETSVADAWDTRVPVVACATLLGAACECPLVAAGGDLHYLLTIRNDGNVHLTGVDLALLDENGRTVSTSTVPFNADTLQPSSWNPPEEVKEGESIVVEPRYSKSEAGGMTAQADSSQRLLNTEDNYELAPGKKAIYAGSIKVPEDWEGEHTVTVSVTGNSWVSTLQGEASATPVILSDVSFNAEAVPLSVTSSVAVDHDVNTDAPVTETSKGSGGNSGGGGSSGSGGSGGSSGSGGSGSSGKGKLARTGDSSALGTAAAALGALGAGMVAYSARRTALEREREGEE